MPELPEVETVKRQLKNSLKGNVIRDVSIYNDKMIKVGAGKISNIKRGSKKDSLRFIKAVRGKKILDVKRRGKFLIIELSGGLNLMIHLRMSGQLIYLEAHSLGRPIFLSLAQTAVRQRLPTKHTHVEFSFKNGSRLFYNDTRQFGHIRLANEAQLREVFKGLGLGPEPLGLTLEDFKILLNSRPEKRIKDLLLDQKTIAGIGNIYADESLFMAGIMPARQARTLTAEEITRLHSAIQDVLRKAIKFGGSSLEYFLMTNGSAGKFSEQHLVYGKNKSPCPNCGEILSAKKIGSRTATFCLVCQV